MTTKEEIKHYDKVGDEVFPGDYVVIPNGRSQIELALVVKLNPKMLKVKRITGTWSSNVYASETIKIDPGKVTMYVLRNKK